MGNTWIETLDRGDILLIDGGMGTELQRRGVSMDKVAQGVRLLGGCCGTSPDHIEALQAAIPELEAARGA
jgi:methionine synthase I (cobalamin-dependent)